MITLQVPYAVPTLTLTLPNPILGDSISQSLKTKFGFAMSGKILTTISRQVEKKIQYSFENLRRSHIDGLLALLDTYAGSDIKLTDYSGVIWRVKCLSNPIEFTEDRHFYSCKLDFQGITV
jgi:hypothetical protein